MQIEKVHWKTEEAFNSIRRGQPVVLRDCPLISPSYVNWSLEGIAGMIDKSFLCDVFVSVNNWFPYHDLTKNTYDYPFTAPTRKVAISFGDFVKLLRSEQNTCTEMHYLQQSLVAEMGQSILNEYSKFSLQTAALYKVLAGWNELTHNLLLCGREGYVTPLHFDEQENIFTQLSGRKRVRLFPPDCWSSLYPYPNGHPCDRQSQVRLPDEPGCATFSDPTDTFRFPAFSEVAGKELVVDLEPGDVLYIPQYWFHQMIGLDENVSLSWWFKHVTKRETLEANASISVNVGDICMVAVRRNIESLVSNMVGSGQKAHRFFLALASGRVRIPGIEYKTAPSSSRSVTVSAPASARVEEECSSQEVVPRKPVFTTTDLIVADTDAGALKLADLDEEQWGEVATRAVSLLSMIFRPEYAPGVLLQVVSGRFHSF